MTIEVDLANIALLGALVLAFLWLLVLDLRVKRLDRERDRHEFLIGTKVSRPPPPSRNA
jgi:hypothetical protein